MYLKSISITSYKSFLRSEEIEFTSGVNLIVGINNSGKTALLEALSLRFNNHPYAGPSRDESINSQAIVTFCIFRDEIEQLRDGNKLNLPAFQGQEPSTTALLLEQSATIEVILRCQPEGKFDGDPVYSIGGKKLQPLSNSVNHYVESGGKIQYVGGASPLMDLLHLEVLAKDFALRIFSFHTERSKVHSASFGNSSILKSDASNLAEVLTLAHSENATRFKERYLSLVTRVLPNVKYISSAQGEGGILRLYTWPEAQLAEGPNVRHSLEHSGTGIGQVLAILYVVVYSDPTAVVIDEPNSFLHPAATRELLRIFRENSKHQYFISTHSPEVFSEVKPTNFTKLKYENYESKLEVGTFGNLSETFRELGISPFYERTLWVEGETEEAALPIILNDSSLQVHKLYSTADIARGKSLYKEVDRIVDIYSRMTSIAHGASPAGSVMRILLDGEHSPKKKADYERRTDKIVHFLPRLMFENYLLDPRAISFVLSEVLAKPVSPSEIETFLAKKRGGVQATEWLKIVDGSMVLEDLFSDYTAAYKKTTHSVALASWIAQNDPKKLDSLRDFIQAVFTDRGPD